MAPAPHFPQAVPARPVHGGSQVVFVPVDGWIVLWCCVLLIVFCLVWLGLLLHQGVDHDRAG